MKCQACEDGLHYLCGMQAWCECDCEGPYESWGPSPDDDMPHSDTCTCASCVQNYPERMPESWEDDDGSLTPDALDGATGSRKKVYGHPNFYEQDGWIKPKPRRK